jgi:FMN phosphatase YigB (HAD superfamily)
MRPLIFFDIDDVLHECHTHIARQVEQRLGVTVRYEDRTRFHACDLIPGCSKQTELKMVYAMYRDPAFWAERPMPDGQAAVAALSGSYRLAAMTSRPDQAEIVGRTHDWLDRYFNGVFEQVVFSSLVGEATYRSKADRCAELGAAAIVDDARHNLEGCHRHGVLGFLVDRPWNRHEPDHPDFARIHDLAELPSRLDQLLAAAA